MHFETWNTKQIIANRISKWLIINILEYSNIRATYHGDKWLLLWNKILRFSEKWLFLRLSQLCVDELYLCWRERATRDWSQTTEAGIKDKRNFRILSYLIFYPNIKFDFLGDILSATLSITLSIILSVTLSNIKSWETHLPWKLQERLQTWQHLAVVSLQLHLVLRISEKWLFLRFPQLSIDKLYLCWRERAAAELIEMWETRIEVQPCA